MTVSFWAHPMLVYRTSMPSPWILVVPPIKIILMSKGAAHTKKQTIEEVER